MIFFLIILDLCFAQYFVNYAYRSYKFDDAIIPLVIKFLILDSYI